MSETESTVHAPVFTRADWAILDRFEDRVSSIEVVRRFGASEIRTVFHLRPKDEVRHAPAS